MQERNARIQERIRQDNAFLKYGLIALFTIAVTFILLILSIRFSSEIDNFFISLVADYSIYIGAGIIGFVLFIFARSAMREIKNNQQ